MLNMTAGPESKDDLFKYDTIVIPATAEDDGHSLTIYEFEHAPEILKELSFNEGDEDYIAEVPDTFNGGMTPLFLDEAFGCCTVEKHRHPTRKGWLVYIGCHA